MYKTISIVIPAYNEENFIEKVLSDVLKSNTLGLHKEIVVVDDGSTDLTTNKINAFKKAHKNIMLISGQQNFGKGYAIKQGILGSSGDIVLIQDADLEYSPDDYPSLLLPFIESRADVVYGSRLSTSKAHRVLFFWHYKANQFLTFFSNLFTNLNLTDMETGFKVFNGNMIRSIAPRLVSRRFGIEPELTARIARVPGIKIFEVGISYNGRTYAEGKKIGWRDGILALFEIIRFNLFSK